ncbi:MAG: hypothetical protein C0591_03190 [Marinilabiliales bacterium]|nr:MAG: hypothetical protein C0591_03190 [Marinilabiliales bacterium]
MKHGRGFVALPGRNALDGKQPGRAPKGKGEIMATANGDLQIFRDSTHTAVRPSLCDCQASIPVGREYRKIVGKIHGEFFTSKVCINADCISCIDRLEMASNGQFELFGGCYV